MYVLNKQNQCYKKNNDFSYVLLSHIVELKLILVLEKVMYASMVGYECLNDNVIHANLLVRVCLMCMVECVLYVCMCACMWVCVCECVKQKCNRCFSMSNCPQSLYLHIHDFPLYNNIFSKYKIVSNKAVNLSRIGPPDYV